MEVAAAKLSEEFGQETGRVLDPVSGKRLAGNMRVRLIYQASSLSFFFFFVN
jgi:hypothetical protein